ncbi:MAG: P-II family nitrogen regulator [Candidatus Helarchaeota archaeon]
MVIKKIECFIRPEKLEPVKMGLFQLGICGMTIYEVKGHGRQRGIKFKGRAGEYYVEWIDKLKLEIVIDDSINLDDIINVIIENAKTGNHGDGKIFVSHIDDSIRIRTGERGESSIK